MAFVDKKVVVVFGATGVQGSSVAKALLRDPSASHQFHVRAITRDPSKPAAVALIKKGAEITKGDLEDRESLRMALKDAYAVYAVTNFAETMDTVAETRQGKNVADIAKELDVKHLIWSALPSIAKFSNNKLTLAAHFESKAMVTDHIRSLSIPHTTVYLGAYTSLILSLLNPVSASPPSYNLVFPEPVNAKTKIPLIDASTDLGKFVKGILLNPEKSLNRQFNLATKYYTVGEMVNVFKECGLHVILQIMDKGAYKAALASQGLPEWFQEDLLQVFQSAEEFGMYGREDDIEEAQKCDECKPICERCRRNRRQCVYGRPYDSEHEHGFIGRVTTSGLSAVTLIADPYPSPKNGTPGIQLLHHFYTNWDDIFHIPGRDELASLSQSNSLIRNTIFAITACHLRHMSPGILEHRIAEHFHQSLAIRDFQKALETPGRLLGQQGVDAMLLAALLLNMIAFTLPHQENSAEKDPRSSGSPASLNLIVGVFGEDGWTAARTSRRPHSLDIVPETWIRAFQLKNDSSSCDSNVDADPNDVLRPAAIALAYLRGIDPSQSKIFLNLMFLTKIHGDFRSFLYNKDERAVWIFGYWLGLMCRYEGTWWCEQRVRRDYRAVRMWLDELQLGERAGDDGLYWKAMMRELELAPVFTPTEH
ncbi:hypothetical protein EG329_007268 [Mollisiaceae sp. DMI_Dod_QoI]|nr:hypothetical protein EG329_007268 [Helotiales sp. DMI_Dod_QoI]